MYLFVHFLHNPVIAIPIQMFEIDQPEVHRHVPGRSFGSVYLLEDLFAGFSVRLLHNLQVARVVGMVDAVGILAFWLLGNNT